MLDEMADLSKRPASDSTASCSRRDQRAWELMVAARDQCPLWAKRKCCKRDQFDAFDPERTLRGAYWHAICWWESSRRGTFKSSSCPQEVGGWLAL